MKSKPVLPYNYRITLRDHFAIAALTAFKEVATEADIGSSQTGRANWWWKGEEIANRCYSIAEAMLKARDAK